VVDIPVIIPENPWTKEIPEIYSEDTAGNGTITWGGFETEYPNPGLVIVIGVVNEPFDTFIVAVAIVPIPIPVAHGFEILTVTELPTYPDPGFTIVRALIVPAELTVDVIAADTGFDDPPSTINPSKDEIVIPVKFCSYLKKFALSTNNWVSVVIKFLITFAVG
jgi:hypothetical protein